MLVTRPRIRSTLLVLLALLTTSMAAEAQQDQTPLLPSLHEFQVSNFVALSAYYQFSATNATDVLNEVVAGINEANAAMDIVSEASTEVFDAEQVAALAAEFGSFKELMRQNINDVRDTGYPDLRLVSQMANQAQNLATLSAELYAVGREVLGEETNPQIEAARSAAVLMSQMMAKYSARSYSSVSQTFQGSDSESALDEQAAQFDSLVARLTDTQSTGELNEAIDGVATKWEFIRNSYINFNDDNVPFIIERYSKGILRELATAIDLLAQTA